MEGRHRHQPELFHHRPDHGLGPLAAFGIERVLATTMQAVSGAGYPGVASFDILGNVVPFVGGEEEKMQQETQKILGTYANAHVTPLAASVSAHCNRVPVADGHTVAVSVEFSAKPTVQDLLNAFAEYIPPAATQLAQRAAQPRRLHARAGSATTPPRRMPARKV